jgi:hypothetical protein
MRTFKAALFLAVFLLIGPAPAQAWFGWLDDLSGPGPFWGQQYEVRLACFGPPDEVTKKLDDLLFTARVLTFRVVDPATLRAANEAWERFAAEANSARSLRPSDVQALTEGIKNFKLEEVQKYNAQIRPPSEGAQTPGQATNVAPGRFQTGPIADLLRMAAALRDQSYKANVSVNSTGMFWSLCSPQTTRRLAVELGLTFWQANSRPEFAKDYTVRLITFMPSISYRLFKDPRHDVLDVGAGAGVYWFSSRGFDTFSGLLVQPARVDFHAPTQWVNAGGIKSALGLITIRAAVMGFPAGFDAGAFAGLGDKAAAIPSDFRPTVTVFFNTAPLLRRPKDVR